ncbi:ATP-binding cassette domain-containing protein [Frankia sp. CNm7]|uniref:ATP-binding cassette domain-containing protein n=1 Tax=Frankia nepalensis TaxID=1836974 RepID=A0A937UK41_9ACTN|nr:ATP-binding cassette domain-containing protein [Frankia nepalensis]MBL7502694.1 ATP-binding cassette domain-containing protein [Frankia nepalensis]MBL7514043.1 ATP-binding cassette domain-containing protein [Frankia nepalensis]MBL7520212.1 ATP-binding cassette domain-containing protein [Frankia nepalensis]MBL7626429.1 ATP-binding cassette domain-containing protein [Frankia nepalensis]
MTAAVEADALVKTFGDIRALDGLSLRVEAGTILGLLGPNGAGKTTAINVLTTLLRPDSGHARVAGHDVVDEPALVRASIGVTGQFASLDAGLTPRENLVLFGRLMKLGRAEARRRAAELLERFALTEAADQRTGTLSGGTRRRLDLAASITREPAVLFLDEPTTGLDPRSRLALWQAVRELRASGITILLTTQYLEEADELADRVTIIDRGKVVAEGTAAQLKQRVGGAVCHITIADPTDRQLVADALTSLGPVSLTSDGVSLPASGPETLVAVVRQLDEARHGGLPIAQVDDIGLRRPTLDDVFLALTGHSAAPEAGAGDEVERLARPAAEVAS